jgi:ribosome-associated heat shock protein Hsp15
MNRRADAVAGAAGLRLDKWLWFARFARTRSLAAKLCGAGHVSMSGVPALKPHHIVRVGDRITVVQGRWKRNVVVLALGERRGSPAAARLLYAEPEPPAALGRQDAEEWTPLLDEGFLDPA